MLKDMTLGQYYPVDSVIHRLDPRTKLSATMLYIISLFLANHPLAYLCSFLFFALAVGLSRVPFRYIAKGLKPIFVLDRKVAGIILVVAALLMLIGVAVEEMVSIGFGVWLYLIIAACICYLGFIYKEN